MLAGEEVKIVGTVHLFSLNLSPTSGES